MSGTLSRVRWLAALALVIVLGLLGIVPISSLVLAAGTAWSTGIALDLGRILSVRSTRSRDDPQMTPAPHRGPIE